MVIMAGMLPGVECARRRRLRQGGGAAAGDAAACSGTRRPSFCLYAAGHGRGGGGGGHPPGNPAACKQRSGVMEMIHEWMLDSNTREAKERLDQKLRSKREGAAIKRHHSTGSTKLSRALRGSGGGGDGEGSSSSSSLLGGVQREVYSKKGVMMMRRLMLRWSRPQAPRWAAAEHQAECAVCLDEFRAGDVLAHLLPCGHRFHWACALPWLEGTPRCPFCRAAIDGTGSGGNPYHHGRSATAAA